jgi:hypothetical protein
MDKSISIAGIKGGGNGTNVLYAKATDYDAAFEEKSDNVWKNLAS